MKVPLRVNGKRFYSREFYFRDLFSRDFIFERIFSAKFIEVLSLLICHSSWPKFKHEPRPSHHRLEAYNRGQNGHP